jgi:glycosyltransferase involved in cell wall biosynthesis
MERSRPLLLLDQPAHREVAGDAAFYFAKDATPEALARMVQNLDQNFSLRLDLGTRAQLKSQHYSWRKTAEAFARLLNASQ